MPKLKVLALVHGEMTSHTVRVVAVAKALRQTGKYDIIFSGQGQYMKFVADAGFDWIKTKLPGKEELYSSVEQNLASIYYTKDNYENYFQIEKSVIESIRPDIIIRDHFREMAGVAAKIAKIRAYDVFIQKATLSPYYHFDFKPDKLPQWISLLPEKFLLFAAAQIENHFRKKNSKYIRLKVRQLGLKQYLTIDGVRPDLVLFPDAEEIFELPQADRRFCKHIGPLIMIGQNPPPDWLESFGRDKRKKILISMGTTGEHQHDDFFADVFSDEQYAVALYSVANKKVADFYGCGKFEIEPVLPYCDLFITHGGTGSNYLSMKHKVPMICLYDHFEQQINAVELDRKGLAINIRKKDRTKINLLAAADKILTESYFKDNVSAISEKIKQYDSLKLALEYISAGYDEFIKKQPR